MSRRQIPVYGHQKLMGCATAWWHFCISVPFRVCTTLPALGQSQGYSTACESYGSNIEKTKTSPGKKDWIWTGSKGQSDDDTGIEDCYGTEKLEVKIWLGKNKDGSQEQNIYGPVGQKVCVEEQHRCDLMCRSEEGKEWLGKELWTKEEQGVDKYLMEDRYLTGIKVQTETWDGLERKSEIKGYTVNEPGVWGGSLREEISRKAEYWQGGEREHGQTQG